MYIAHVTSELAPFAKVGGLADVVYGLAKATAEAGHHVEVWLPKYGQIKASDLQGLTALDGHVSAKLGPLSLKLIEEPELFHREAIYGYRDDVERFCHFVHKVVQQLQEQKPFPDVIHLHDWPVALVAPLIAHLSLPNTRILLTIHNLEHQGRCLPHQIAATGLKQSSILEDPRKPGDCNLLMTGIHFSDWITTVSPTYLQEILTPAGGHGLDRFLEGYKAKLRSVLNGIDSDYWNPTSDIHLISHYGVKTLRKKEGNKRHLRKLLGLGQEQKPLVASITRLVPQKGPELIEAGLRYTLQRGGQFLLIGNSPIPEMQSHFTELAQELSSSEVAFALTYNEPLAHLAYAAADLLLIPSHFEPCGLTQMIAMRYGAIPVVRATGGLKDTVFDWDTSSEPPEKRNGFRFETADREGVEETLERAFRLYQQPKVWQRLMIQAMEQDFSWNQSMQKYLALYQNSL
jgi:starch synthase